jgi:hypothetical protein
MHDDRDGHEEEDQGRDPDVRVDAEDQRHPGDGEQDASHGDGHRGKRNTHRPRGPGQRFQVGEMMEGAQEVKPAGQHPPRQKELFHGPPLPTKGNGALDGNKPLR